MHTGGARRAIGNCYRLVLYSRRLTPGGVNRRVARFYVSSLLGYEHNIAGHSPIFSNNPSRTQDMTRTPLAYRLFTVLLVVLITACGSDGNDRNNDVDGDGIVNSADNCPGTSNANQLDADNDGVGDACEADADEDGVVDDNDQCPATDPGLTVDTNGCADNQLDSDGDDISNDADACPATPAGQTVDSDGCPISGTDSDGDGVFNENDVCPESVLTDSNGAAFEFFASGCPKLTLSRNGITYDVVLPSDVDGQAIAFTIHEPRRVDPASKYPIIGQSHGYSLTRTSARAPAGGTGIFSLLADNGYGAFSMDQRGHGDSGGQIRLLDPEREGLDMLQILEWLTDNVSWLDFAEGGRDYLLGAFGSSYGGGFAHTIFRLDPLQRLDAMVPDITWNDLRYSINSNNVFKSKWALLLSSLANSTPGGHHPDVDDGLQQGLSTGDLNDTQKALLYRSSLAYNCDATNTGDIIVDAQNRQIDVGRVVTPIPTLYTQGTSDTLFDLTETWRNFDCLSTTDPSADIRVWTQPFSHDDLIGQGVCGGLLTTDATLAFFDRHIKGLSTALNDLPEICFNISGISVSRTRAMGFPVGNDGDPGSSFDASHRDPLSGALIPVAVSEGNATTINVPVYTATADNEVLAGIPTITLNLQRDQVSANVPTDGIIFIGISISRDSGATYSLPNRTSSTGTGQVTPFRDSQVTAGETRELVGIEDILDAGDMVAVQYATKDATYQNSGSRSAVTLTIEAAVDLPLLGRRGVDVTAVGAP